MTSRSDIPRLILAAMAAGDMDTIAALAIEMNGELFAAEATIAELRRADDERREKQADRKRRSRRGPTPDSGDVGHVTSRDGAGQSVTERDGTGPLPPVPPLLPPTPPNNSSLPPIPASPSSAPASGSPEADAETALLDRFDHPADRRAVGGFLDRAADPVRRLSWVGRLGALLDKPPHFTPAELAEGLEALLTQDAGTWGPALLKVWVRRVRADAAREVLVDAEVRTGVATRSAPAGGDAAAAWEYVSGELLRKHIQRTLTMDDMAALGPRSRAALRSIGGLPMLSQHDSKQMPFARRDFLAAFARGERTHLDGAAA